MISIGLRHLIIQNELKQKVIIQRRQLRDASNPMELPNTLVNKDAFTYLLGIVTTALQERKNCRSILPIIKLSACLRFFAEGSYQTSVGNDFDIGLAQSSFSETLSEILKILEEKLCPIVITLPTNLEKREISQSFYQKYKLPGVVGCVDGTHVAIATPSKDRHLFYNRKGFNSMNVMLICDHRLQIRYVDARRPRSCHDAFIWDLSSAKAVMEKLFNEVERNYHLLGDSGYPLQPWLLTPFRLPISTSAEIVFNEAHTKCRNGIERTNGVLKNRWRCLLGARMLHYAPLKATKIINVCCALHNVCIKYKVHFEEPLITTQTYMEVGDEFLDNPSDIAKSKRLNIARTLL